MTRKTLTLLLLLMSIPILLCLCLLMGASGVGIPDLGTDIGRSILLLRLNRLLCGLVVGAALSCAGVVFQAILRNPLADPYVLGVSSGAGLGAALCILTGISLSVTVALPASAFIAGALTLAIVFFLAGRRGGSPSVYGLILSGVIVGSICSSFLMFLIARADKEGLHSVIWWMLGNLQPATPGLLAVSAVITFIGCMGIWAIAPELNALTLGKEIAHNVGIRTTVIIITGLGLATLVTAAAVGMAGLIGFVGLIVPHVMRALVGPDHKRLIPMTILCGGVFLSLCDAIARTVFATEVPVGVVTAVCGGPFFLIILNQRRRSRWTE
jgi:iron complex transport system permease protein